MTGDKADWEKLARHLAQDQPASATYNNGILEVTFDRVDDSTSIDF